MRDDVNLKFYGKKVAPADVLRGRVKQPPAAQCLYGSGRLLRRARSSTAAFGGAPAYEYQSQRSTASSAGGGASASNNDDPFGSADPVVEVHQFINLPWIVASTSTPSTRRLLDSVAVPVPLRDDNPQTLQHEEHEYQMRPEARA